MPKLSPAERAILIAQYRTLAAIEDDRDGYKAIITVLERGYESEYEEHIEGLSDPLPEEECRYVRDILWIYYLLKVAKNRDAVDDPGGDRDATGRLRFENLEPKFPGFDGNSEPARLGYAKFLIGQGQFVEHTPVANSHGMQPDYRAMIALHEAWGSPTKLTPEQAAELLDC